MLTLYDIEFVNGVEDSLMRYFEADAGFRVQDFVPWVVESGHSEFWLVGVLCFRLCGLRALHFLGFRYHRAGTPPMNICAS